MSPSIGKAVSDVKIIICAELTFFCMAVACLMVGLAGKNNSSKSILKKYISMMCIFHKVILATIDCHGKPTCNLNVIEVLRC